MDETEFIQEIMHQQPVINVGVIGHVANGKSSIVEAVSGIATQKYKKEKERNITIRLGYANVKIYKCDKCERPECYQSTGSEIMEHNCVNCGEKTELVRHISFIDCPGHIIFMTTMMNGACVMDDVILVESGSNAIIPAPQTVEHFKITKEIGISTKFICLNKVDLMMKDINGITSTMESLRTFVDNPEIPIIPVSATLKYNIDVLCEYLANLDIPHKNIASSLKMLIIRSFNVNNPKTKIAELKGGVVGGSLTRGMLKVGDDVSIYPGYISKNSDGETWSYRPLKCKTLSINSDKNSLESAISGGLIGVQLNIDPSMTKDDDLVGQVMFKNDFTDMKVYHGLKIQFTKMASDRKIKKNDKLSVNVNSNNIKCKVCKITTNHIYLDLEKPVCVELGDKVTINLPSEKQEDGLKNMDEGISEILGYGKILNGGESTLLI